MESAILVKESQDLPFGTAAYYGVWWRHLSPKFDISSRYGNLLVHRKQFAKGLLMLRELRLAGWNHAWQQVFTLDNLAEFKQYLVEGGWDYFRMTWGEKNLPLQAFQALEDMGLTLVQLPGKASYIINLDLGWNHYLQTRVQSVRKDFKRKLAKSAHLQPRLHHFKGEKEIEYFYEDFFKYHIPYWTQKVGASYFSDPHEQEFIVAWAKSLAQTGQLALQGLLLGDKIANLSMSCRGGDTVYFMKMINTEHYSEYYPGILSTYLRAEELAHQGVSRIDLGFNNYNYKRFFSTSQERSYELMVANPKSLKGKMSVRWLSRKLSRLPLSEIT